MLCELSSPLRMRVHRFLGIPVRSTWFRHPLDPALWCVDSEASVNVEDGQPQSFFGHAADTDQSAALQRACFELLERMLATRPFVPACRLRAGLAGRLVVDRGPVGPFPEHLLFIRGQTPPGSLPASASGLGLHCRTRSAVRHAALELAERDAVLAAWYERERLVRVHHEALPCDHRIDYYTSLDAVPLALAVLSDGDHSVFYCGASVSGTLRVAMAHARAEALHLYSNFIVRGITPALQGRQALRGNPTESLQRIALLHGASAQAMHVHLRTRVESGPVPTKVAGLESILHARFGDAARQAAYVRLGQWHGFTTVRVLIPGARTKAAMRVRHAGIVPDPFC